jgi:hypothetical protein
MSDEKQPKLELVEDTASIFDDLTELRKVSVLKVSRRAVQTNVTVGRPASNIYFRVHPSPEMSLNGSIIIGNDRDDVFFIAPRMLNHPMILPRLRRVQIVVVASWPGNAISLWPVPLEAKVKCWKTLRDARDLAQQEWVQLTWNDDPQRRDYDLVCAEGLDIEPTWPPDLKLSELLKLGFADDGTIAAPDHPYVQQLRGLAV